MKPKGWGVAHLGILNLTWLHPVVGLGHAPRLHVLPGGKESGVACRQRTRGEPQYQRGVRG